MTIHTIMHRINVPVFHKTQKTKSHLQKLNHPIKNKIKIWKMLVIITPK